MTSVAEAGVGLVSHGGEVGALDLSIWISLALSALIVVLILVSWIWYRDRQVEGAGLVVNLLALAIFPLFLLAVGNFAVLEYAKEAQFCGTCHITMKAYVDDLHRPNGESLASLHAQNRFAPGSECYSCHANYGVNGTIAAKMTGLRHVYKYTTGTYHLPIKMPEPFENGLCLKCHEGAKRFMAQSAHLDGNKVAEELRSGKTECIQCHGPAHELGPSKKKTAAVGGEG